MINVLNKCEAVQVIDVYDFFTEIGLASDDQGTIRELIDASDFSYGSNSDTLMSPERMKRFLNVANVKYLNFSTDGYYISFGC